jgi:predicted peptidase
MTGGYYEALPPGYDSTAELHPLLLAIHGGGELGRGNEEDLPMILGNSVAKRVANKTLPVSFTSENVSHSFIIIFPQFYNRPEPKHVKEVFDYVIQKYRVDTNRLYITGLSMGGGVAWEFAASEYGNMLAAMVPICASTDVVTATEASVDSVIANDVPAWSFHNEDDHIISVMVTRTIANRINRRNPPHPVKTTIWPTGWHDAWTKASNPGYREHGKNIYEWMLQYRRN